MLPYLLSTLAFATPVNDNLDVGVYGSWQSIRLNEQLTTQQRIHLRSSFTWDGVTVFVDLMDGRVWGSEQTYKTNKDAFANLYQGYIHLPVFKIGTVQHTLQVGKQEFILNNERYFAPGPWALGGRSFDAAVVEGKWDSGLWRGAVLQLTDGGTYTRPETECVEDCTVSSSGNFISVLHAEQNWEHFSFKPYYIYERDNPSDTNLDAFRRIHSPGLLITGSYNSLFYSLDGTYQWGAVSPSIDHLAWMGAGELGYQKDQWKASVYGELNSGDGDSTDTVNHNLESFIGKYHGLRGLADQVGGSNLRDYALFLQAPLHKKWTFKMDLHQFQLDQLTGNLYAFNGTLIGSADANNTERNIGKEVDILLIQKPYKGVTMRWGHSIFQPEGAKVDYSGSDAIHLSYLWMTVKH